MSADAPVPGSVTADLVHEFETIRRGLIPAYRDYCVHVSTRGHALSLESCTFAYWLCSTRYAKRPADFGSGFSSYTLRRYATSARGEGTNTQPISVDDNPAWLGRTSEFLRRLQYDDAGLMMWDDWLASDFTHDLIVYDYSSGAIREAGMKVVVERLDPGGMILFDDAHHTGHRAAMQVACDTFGLEVLDVHDVTLDTIGRYALAAVKPS